MSGWRHVASVAKSFLFQVFRRTARTCEKHGPHCPCAALAISATTRECSTNPAATAVRPPGAKCPHRALTFKLTLREG